MPPDMSLCGSIDGIFERPLELRCGFCIVPHLLRATSDPHFDLHGRVVRYAGVISTTECPESRCEKLLQESMGCFGSDGRVPFANGFYEPATVPQNASIL